MADSTVKLARKGFSITARVAACENSEPSMASKSFIARSLPERTRISSQISYILVEVRA